MTVHRRCAAAFCIAMGLAGPALAMESNPKAVRAFQQGQYALCHHIAAGSTPNPGNHYWTARCGGEARIQNRPCGTHCRRIAIAAVRRLRAPGHTPKKSYHAWLATRTRGRPPVPAIGHLVRAVARAESNFNPKARSHAGALGYMQVMPATAKAILPVSWTPHRVRRCLLNQHCNQRVGRAYLTEQIGNKHGNLVRALYAYNAGPTNERRWWRTARHQNPAAAIDLIPIRETRNYVRRVLRNLWNDRALAGQHPGASLDAIKNDRWPVAP